MENGGDVNVPLNITGTLSRIATEFPDAPAILDLKSSISYRELEQAVIWTARSFASEGLAARDIVALDLPDQHQHLISSLALARIGVAQIAFCKADSPLLRKQFAKRLKIAAIVCDKDRCTDAAAPVIEPPFRDVCDLKALKAVPSDGAEDAAHPLLILRTSGTSTGIPKLGVLTHAAARPRIEAKGFMLPEGQACRYLSLGDLSLNSVKIRAFHCVLSGSCLVLHRGRLRPQAIVDLIAARRVNYLSCSPSQASSLLELGGRGQVLFPELKALRLGSAFVAQPLREKILRHLTPNLFIAYGMTEVGTVSIAPPAMVRNIAGVVGNLVPGICAEVVDEDGITSPPLHAGRLRLKGPGMLNGYVDTSEESRRVFHDGWFYSDDRVEFTQEGELIHHGRMDDMMIFDGINISPAEIENALLSHPAVSDAAVFAVGDDMNGDVPIAAVVTRSTVLAGKLLSYCQSQLGAHAPHTVFIIPGVPRNAAGKVLKRELEKMYLERYGPVYR